MTLPLMSKVYHKMICCLSTVSPTLTTKILYYNAFKRRLDLKNPKTLNEKLQYLKLHDYYENPLVTQCADKYLVRDYVTDSGCSEILNEFYNVWESADDIIWDELPEKFVLKCNHGCGYNIICDDKSKFNDSKVKEQLHKWMKEDFWKFSAETNYRDIPKRIVCEKYLQPSVGKLPEDYKVYCFNGKAEYVMVCVGREFGRPKFYYFDRYWNLQRLTKDVIEAPVDFALEKPDGIDKVFYYAEELSKPFPFVRADFYLFDGLVYFGELTFTPGACLDNKRLPETDLHLGNLLYLDMGKIK